MRVEYIGLSEIRGPLVILEDVEDVAYDETCRFTLENGEKRFGRIIAIDGSRAVIQVFEGTKGISLENCRTQFLGHPLRIPLSPEILGRSFDGAGRPIDGLGEVYPDTWRSVNGSAINPVSRKYPRNYISTGLSAIDGMATLIQGQKLPIFSGSGLKHNELTAQMLRQARIPDQENAEFAIVFAAVGIKHDVADYFRRDLEESGALERTVMFLNLASDPIIERILTPRCALTAAEYLAFTHGYHVLVIMTDVTAYCEALREFSSSMGEIPSRKGFPSYLYSDLASLFERAGMITGLPGSITQMPILTMPNDDITHPIPDLTGFITEGQIVLSRELEQRGIYPPISVLASLSRLMKDGIGAGFTREDHPDLSNQLFASYAKVQEVRALASVIGEDELAEGDRLYMQFGRQFEEVFLSQAPDEDRSIERTLDIGWDVLSILPEGELDRIDAALLEKYYTPRIRAKESGSLAPPADTRAKVV
ncbi:MAG: V-type ATP synthase subunit B [Clostridiales bacterium]|nr:V-type ATP synthase subunit B [Clostridiales bacterium]